MEPQRVTLVGIGDMGAAMGHALLKAGTRVSIWNRSADRPRVKSLVGAGAVLEADVGTAIARSDGAVMICLLDYDVMYHVLSASQEPAAGSLAGKTIVNLCTGTPRQAREAETWFKRHGASRYFDGGIMSTPDMIGTRHALVVCSGESEESFAGGVAELLGSLGGVHYEAPDAGAAATLDLAALAAMYGMFSGALAGMALLKRRRARSTSSGGGPSVTRGVDKVMAPMVRSLVPFLSQMAKDMDEDEGQDGSGNPLGMELAALRTVLRACEEEGVDAGALAAFAAQTQRTVDETGWDSRFSTVGKDLLSK